MPRWKNRIGTGFCYIIFFAILLPFSTTHAEEDGPLKDQIDRLNGAVKEKQSRVRELDDLIKKYRSRINEQENKQVSLQNEVVLLENRIQEKDAAVQRAQVERDALTLEVISLEDQILDQEQRISKQRDLIGEGIRRIHQADVVTDLDVLLTQSSLSSFFDHVERLKRLQRNLGDSLEQVKGTKTTLEGTKKARDDRRIQLAVQEKQLKEEQRALEGEQNTKTSLVAETQEQEEEFQRILYELKQQQQTTANDIATLEDRLKDKLNAIDKALARGDVLFNWPVPPNRGVSAHFHDPTYPFRRLFEHPGTDIPTPVGTPIKAAAGGYVAWTKKGSAYGNYMMLVHPGGMATVYAHISKFVAKPDTYVERGDVIALSGGRPGDPGAGLSTGPHLHFEVRQGGIPVNPENFLPDLD